MWQHSSQHFPAGDEQELALRQRAFIQDAIERCRIMAPRLAQNEASLEVEHKMMVLELYERADDHTKNVLAMLVCESLFLGRLVESVKAIGRAYNSVYRYTKGQLKAARVDSTSLSQRDWERAMGLSKKKKDDTFH